MKHFHGHDPMIEFVPTGILQLIEVGKSAQT
jgi:hypothetical protein